MNVHQTESDSHLEKYILQQLKKHNVEPKKWKKVIFNFCKEVSSKVILDEKRDKLDVRKYVHIKVMHEEEKREKRKGKGKGRGKDSFLYQEE